MHQNSLSTAHRCPSVCPVWRSSVLVPAPLSKCRSDSARLAWECHVRAAPAPHAAPGPTGFAAPEPASPLYQQIAQALAQLIHGGTLKAGQRLPSVRETALTHGVSISTAMQGVPAARRTRPGAGTPQGRLLRACAPQRIAQPGLSAPPQRSFLIEHQTRSESFAMLHQPGDRASFGGFSPQQSALFDEERLRVAIGRASRVHRHSLTEYNKADAGRPALRQAVARRALHLGCALDAADIVITASCTQAVSLCLRAVTVPGDVVALEVAHLLRLPRPDRVAGPARAGNPDASRHRSCRCLHWNWRWTRSRSRPSWPRPHCPTRWAQ